jgi:hypothetical protein
MGTMIQVLTSCDGCGKVFDLLNKDDVNDLAYAHECEVKG